MCCPTAKRALTPFLEEKIVMGNNLRNSKWNLWNRELPYITEVQRNRFCVRIFLNLKISNLSVTSKTAQTAQQFQNGFKSKHLPWRLKWGTHNSITEFMYAWTKLPPELAMVCKIFKSFLKLIFAHFHKKMLYNFCLIAFHHWKKLFHKSFS